MMVYGFPLSARQAVRMVPGVLAALMLLCLMTLTGCGGGGSFPAQARLESILYSFKGGTADGSGSQAGLIQAADGHLYRTTIGGGTNLNGTVFKF
jgi:hypothetical protein